MKAKLSPVERSRTGWPFLKEIVLLFERRLLPLEGLQLRNLASRPR